MASPPRKGILEVCNFLSPGSSYNSNFFETPMMDGIDNKEINNEVMKA